MLICRAANTDAVTPLTQLLAFFPWLLAPAALALFLALYARWRPGMAWAALTTGVLAWFLQPYGTTAEPTTPPLTTLRVLTSNVEFGYGTPSLIARIHETKPDVVFIPECEEARCTRELNRAFGNPAADGTADRTAAGPGAKGTYPYRQTVASYGSAGSVILSRFPLPPAPTLPPQMGMPSATADVDGNPVRLQLAHPMPPLPGQVDVWKRELARIRTFAAATPGPLILAGDFNASEDHAAFRRILNTGLRDTAALDGDTHTPSWPSRTAPPFGTQIDHVLVSGEFSAADAHFLDIAHTDHRALVVDLTLHSGQ
ncbi:Endonuclease/exonuclease/phosphatase [Actinobacteria bacterium OK074]|nr:Endonuclease/exonuclease/phosphatase [Actinobacteria bacterium OK074]